VPLNLAERALTYAEWYYTLAEAKKADSRIYNDIDLLADKSSISDIEKNWACWGG
jgi:hypothetical protein